MSEAVLDIKQWVRVTVEKDRVVITPAASGDLSLDQMLALYDPARHGGEVMAAPLIGAERW